MFGRTRYYTIHEPPEAGEGTEEAVFVREGFSYAAWVFGPLWFFWHRLWWEATGFMAIDLLFIAAALAWPEKMLLVGAFGHVLLAWAAAVFATDFMRLELSHDGWRMTGVASGHDQEDAELRYFLSRDRTNPQTPAHSSHPAHPAG